MHIDGGANIFAIFYTLHLKTLSYTQASGSQAQSNGVGIALFRFAGTNKVYPCPAFYVPDNPVSSFSPGALKYYIGFKSALHEPSYHTAVSSIFKTVHSFFAHKSQTI
eukprot:scaffold118389_cov51-Attheya_sp.AAC.4